LLPATRLPIGIHMSCVPLEAPKATACEDFFELIWCRARSHQAHAQYTRRAKLLCQVLCPFGNDAATCCYCANVFDETQKADFLPFEAFIHAHLVLNVNGVEPVKQTDNVCGKCSSGQNALNIVFWVDQAWDIMTMLQFEVVDEIFRETVGLENITKHVELVNSNASPSPLCRWKSMDARQPVGGAVWHL